MGVTTETEPTELKPVMRIAEEDYKRMREHKNFPNLLALYTFYLYQSINQNSIKIRATIKYCAKSLGWSSDQARWIKQTLVREGLIREISSNKSEDGNSYIILNYMEDHKARRWVL